MKKVYYIANVRMPSEKAYGIQMAKMCEALIEEGVHVTLVLPSRGAHGSMREFYGLRVEVPTIYLPALLFKSYEKVGFALMGVSFMFSYFIFLWWKFICGERFLLYTIDTDRYASSALSLIPAPLFTEMHGAKPHTLFQRLLFRRLLGVIAINKIIVEELQATFANARARYLVEPNGVDLTAFASADKSQARTKLALPIDAPTVLYAGRYYEWKGLEIIPRAAALTPSVCWQMVGGTKEEFETLVHEPLPPNMFFVGSRPYSEMPQWIAAADAVLVLGTKRDEQSYRWTSPMKLFEYMAAGRPIVASGTPAIREIVSDQDTFLYEPDNAEDLAHKVEQAVKGGEDTASKVRKASEAVQERTWSGRAFRVVHFIESTLYEPRRS